MLTIIHGDDTASSRKYLFEKKQNFLDAQILDGEKIDLTQLAQIFDGGELFVETKVVFIENFLTKRKKSSERNLLISSLQKYATANEIILWEGKELDKSALNQFKLASVNIFKLPQTLFLFVDSLMPHNGQQLIRLFHQTLAATEVEMIFFMLVRQIRILLALSTTTQEKIDEIKRLAPWQITKLQSQTKSFTTEQLKFFYYKLFTLEKGQKTGTLSSPLVASIDFLLLEI